jgi:hypothetical protein
MVPTKISTNPVTGVDINVLRKVGVASVRTPDGVVHIKFNLDSSSPYTKIPYRQPVKIVTSGCWS